MHQEQPWALLVGGSSETRGEWLASVLRAGLRIADHWWDKPVTHLRVENLPRNCSCVIVWGESISVEQYQRAATMAERRGVPFLRWRRNDTHRFHKDLLRLLGWMVPEVQLAPAPPPEPPKPPVPVFFCAPPPMVVIDDEATPEQGPLYTEDVLALAELMRDALYQNKRYRGISIELDEYGCAEVALIERKAPPMSATSAVSQPEEPAQPTEKRKRTYSPEAIERIRAGAQKRWALFHAARAANGR